MKRSLLLAMLLIPSLYGTSLASVPIMPYDEVKAGMRGTGRTVFVGTRVESFDVEILGTLDHIGPDQNLILARCSGGPLERTGVMAGMSGSPVMIDGRLIGAIAYSWTFAREPIAGITPIGEMLAIAERDLAIPGVRTGAAAREVGLLDPLTDAGRLERFFVEELAGALQRPAGAYAAHLPLSVSGLGARGLVPVESLLSGAGFLPLQAGGSGHSGGPVPPIEPGSAMGLQLVRGDIEMTATGTVTWVDGKRVLGFGHPLFGLGSLDLPLTGAKVQTLLPSLMRSARIATPAGEIGSLRQDRSSGVYALLDARPRMIPVRLKFHDSGDEERIYSFDVADDPLLAPLLLYASLNGILSSRERPAGSATVRLKEGSVIKWADGEDVALDNVFSGTRAVDYGTGIAAYILYLLMNNVWTPPRIAGVNLILEYDEVPRSATLRSAFLDRYHVHPGETLELTVVLTPFRGPERVLTTRFRIPEETAPGALTLQVGSALAIARSSMDDEPVLPRDLDQLIRLINRLRRNDRIHIEATRADSGLLLLGARLPNLPPSAATVLSRPRSKGNHVAVQQRVVLEESVLTDYAIEGLSRIELEIEAP